MSNNFDTIGLFPVPLLKIKFKDHYKYNFSETEKKDEKPSGWWSSVHTTFPSIPDNDPIVPSMVRDTLKRDLKDVVLDVFKELNLPTNINFLQLWYNIYHDNQGQEAHNHLPFVGSPAPLWSGIYYNKNASPTKIFNINDMVDTQKFKGWEESQIAPCLAAACLFPVEDGDIILFPPYLEHSVQSEPQHKDKMRMTFSFNIKLEGQTSHNVYSDKLY